MRHVRKTVLFVVYGLKTLEIVVFETNSNLKMFSENEMPYFKLLLQLH